jgi:hypothetical protein
MKSKIKKWMALPRARPILVGLPLLEMNESFRGTIGTA